MHRCWRAATFCACKDGSAFAQLFFTRATFPKQPEQKDRLRTAPETLLGQSRLQHGQLFPEDAPAAISTCANDSKTLLLHSILLTSRSQSTLQQQHLSLLFRGTNDQSPCHLGGHHRTKNGGKGTWAAQPRLQPLTHTSPSPQQELEKVVKLLLCWFMLVGSQAYIIATLLFTLRMPRI